MSSSKPSFLRMFTILLALALAGLFLLNLKFAFISDHKKEPLLPAYGEVSNIQLVDSSGKAFSRSDMSGNKWVANFIFTRCPSMCPTMSLQFQLLSKTLPSDVGLVSFSVDPDHDTPEVLAVYAKKYNTNNTKWHFVTGQKDAISKMIQSCHLGVEDDPNMHSLRFILIDDKGQIRGYYDSTDPGVLQKIREDISKLP